LVFGFWIGGSVMQEEKDLTDYENEKEKREKKTDQPETAERPVPGIKHKPEPDAENIMPAEDRPGTL
jgi:hypothetical protein